MSEDMQQRIVNATRKLFGQYSYSKISIDDILHAAQVSRGSLYKYFKSKDELFQHVVLTELLNLKMMLEQVFTNHNALEQRIYNVIISLDRYLDQNPLLFKFLIPNQNIDQEIFPQLDIKMLNELGFSAISGALQQAINSGELPKIDLTNATRLFQFLIRGLFISKFAGDQTVNKENVYNWIAQFITYGLKGAITVNG